MYIAGLKFTIHSCNFNSEKILLFSYSVNDYIIDTSIVPFINNINYLCCFSYKKLHSVYEFWMHMTSLILE